MHGKRVPRCAHGKTSPVKCGWLCKAKQVQSSVAGCARQNKSSQVWLAVNTSSQVWLAVNTSSQVWLAMLRQGCHAVPTHTFGCPSRNSVVNGIVLLGMDRETLIEIILRAPAIAISLIATVALHAHDRPGAIRHMLRVIIQVA